jgi:cell division septation protein DedD
VITPSLPLGEAITLSKDLSADNLKVRVRRVGAPQPASTSQPATPSSEGAETLHRVRVGSFADRASAVAVLRDLETKGYKPFLVRE